MELAAELGVAPLDALRDWTPADLARRARGQLRDQDLQARQLEWLVERIELAVTNAIARCVLDSREHEVPEPIDHSSGRWGRAPGYVQNRQLLEED